MSPVEPTKNWILGRSFGFRAAQTSSGIFEPTERSDKLIPTGNFLFFQPDNIMARDGGAATSATIIINFRVTPVCKKNCGRISYVGHDLNI